MTRANTITSYTITITKTPGTVLVRDKENVFNKGYGREEGLEKLKSEVLEFISNLGEDEKIGVLVVAQKMEWCESAKVYDGCNMLHNIYSHIYEDMSNWVTVKEFREYINSLRYKEY